MTSVKINVKSPTSTDDQTLTTTLESSVSDLKRQIEVEWPQHPRPQDQRLVYAGKLLEDAAILKDVLRLSDARDENDAFTVHLVCRMTTPPPTMAASRSKEAVASEESVLRRRIQTPQQPHDPRSDGSAAHSMNHWYNQASQNPDQVLLLANVVQVLFTPTHLDN